MAKILGQHSDGSNCYTNGCRLRSLVGIKESIETFFGNSIPKNRLKEIKKSNPKQDVEKLKRNLIKNYGIKLDLRHDSVDFVILSQIIIPKDRRKTGVGTEVMNKIITTADKKGWNLALTPSDSFGSSKNRLEVFYRRFGFIKNAGRKRDFTTMESMIRYAS